MLLWEIFFGLLIIRDIKRFKLFKFDMLKMNWFFGVWKKFFLKRKGRYFYFFVLFVLNLFVLRFEFLSSD